MDAQIEKLVAEIVSRAEELPQINASVRLRALVSRLTEACERQQDLEQAASALVSGTTRALERDVWARLDRAAHRLRDAVSTPPR
jgi:hypothetical protein